MKESEYNDEYTGDISVSAIEGKVTFSEFFDSHYLYNVKLPNLVDKWINTFSKFNYRTVEIIFSTFTTFQENTDAFCNYIPTFLLANGSWKEASEKPLEASLSLTYTLNQKQFNLKMDDFHNGDVTGVSFYGSFPYKLGDNTTVEKVNSINKLLGNWQEDLKIYKDIVNKKFLGLN